MGRWKHRVGKMVKVVKVLQYTIWERHARRYCRYAGRRLVVVSCGSSVLLYVRVNCEARSRQAVAGSSSSGRQFVTTPTQSLHHTLILLYLLRQLSILAQLHLPPPSKTKPR